jgi:uncharacterized protein (TIGR00730 family)
MRNHKYLSKIDWTGEKAKEEVVEGLELLTDIDEKKITIFGSHLTPEDDEYYQHAKSTAKALGERGFAILSGGGPGIMQAANTGATEADTSSVGLREGPLQQEEGVDDDIYTHIYEFHFMFVRRFILAINSEALIFYPGGYGTLNELFEYAVLVQTGLMEHVPLILVGEEYWEGLFDWMHQNMVEHNLLTNHIDDLNILHIVDSREDVLSCVSGYCETEL